jgi:hypothetical protein
MILLDFVPVLWYYYFVTVRAVVKILRKHKPKTADQAIAAGIPLKFFGEGCSRQVFRVSGLKMVVKFPMACTDPKGNNTASYNLRHAQQEIRAFRRIRKMKSGAHIRKHLPEVYYEDARRGVIAMKQYRRHSCMDFESLKAECLNNYLRIFFCVDEVNDYGGDNFGIENGVLKILDLGIT